MFRSLLALAAVAFTGVYAQSNQGAEEPYNALGDGRVADSFGNSQLTPACSNIECGAMTCDAPFVLTKDSTCCGTCTAPDHVVPLDRHQAFTSPHATDSCPESPKYCAGPGPATICFTQQCLASEKLHCGPTDCCAKCVA